MKFTFTKTICVLAILFLGLGANNQADAQKAHGMGFAPGKALRQVNFGFELDGYGIPIYAGLDFGVGKMITIGPRIIIEGQRHYTKWGNNKLYTRNSVIIPGFRADYHFSGHIDGLPGELDLYGGLTLGIVTHRVTTDYVDNNGEIRRTPTETYYDTRLWLQVGARYYFNDHWGIQLEVASLGGGDGSLGVTYRFK